MRNLIILDYLEEGTQSTYGGAYSIMIWVGMCREDLKSRPILYQFLPKNETQFYTIATNVKKIYYKFHIIFQNS